MLYSFDHHATSESLDCAEWQVPPQWAQNYPETDAQLIAHVQEGDEASLGILLYRHIGQCRAMIQRILGDAKASEALAQDVFAEVARESARYDEANGPVLSWILTLARRRAIEGLRAGRKLDAMHAKITALADIQRAPGKMAA